MMRLAAAVVAICAAGLGIAAGGAQDKQAEKAPALDLPATVTFSEHIAPIVFDNCAYCHRPGASGPFSLLSYEDTRKRGKLIGQVTQSRTMPPWHPAPGHGEFLHERRLTEKQIALLKRWVETGMAEGDVAKLPKRPEFPDGWTLGKPDVVVTMDKAYAVPATGRDIYSYFTLPVNLPDDHYITAFDLKASAPSVVHHVLLFSGKGEGKGKGNTALLGLLGGGGNSIGGWVPGVLPQHLPMDLAVPFPKGSNVILQTHFHPSGKAEMEKTTVALYFAKKKPNRTLVNFQVPPFFGIASGLNIPAGMKDYKLKGKFKVPVDMELISIQGHAHNVCESIKVTATLPDGSTKSVLFIPKWDFGWQSTYLYKTPLRLPKGAVIEAVLVYNNSTDNPVNPFNPPQRIKWGQATTDEMGSVIVNAVALDENELPTLRRGITSQLLELGGVLGKGKKE